MTTSPIVRPTETLLHRDPLQVIARSGVPIVLEGRYRLLVGALRRVRHSRGGRRVVAFGLGAIATAFAVLAAHHFATGSWPLSNGNAGVLVAAGLLLILAQGLKALGWEAVRTARAASAARAAGGQRGCSSRRRCPSGPLRRRDAGRRRSSLSRLPRRHSRALPLPGHARLDRQRRPGTARARRRSLSGRGDRRPGRTGGRDRRRRRCRRADPCSASAGREQAYCALPARAVAESAHDLGSGRDGSLGARVRLLAHSRGGALPVARHARASASRFHSRCSSSVPEPPRRRFRSARLERRHRPVPAAQPWSQPVSRPPRHSRWPSPSGRSGCSPAARSSSSPLLGESANRCSRLEPPLTQRHSPGSADPLCSYCTTAKR